MSNDPDGLTAEEEKRLEHERYHTDMEVSLFEIEDMIRGHLDKIRRHIDTPRVAIRGTPMDLVSRWIRAEWERIDELLSVLEDMERPERPSATGDDDEVPF